MLWRTCLNLHFVGNNVHFNINIDIFFVVCYHYWKKWFSILGSTWDSLTYSLHIWNSHTAVDSHLGVNFSCGFKIYLHCIVPVLFNPQNIVKTI